MCSSSRHTSKTTKTLFSVVGLFPFGQGVHVEIKTSAPPVLEKNKGVFQRFSDAAHVSCFPCCLTGSVNKQRLLYLGQQREMRGVWSV